MEAKHKATPLDLSYTVAKHWTQPFHGKNLKEKKKKVSRKERLRPRPPVSQVACACYRWTPHGASERYKPQLPASLLEIAESGGLRGCRMSTGTSCRSLCLSCCSSCVSSELAFLQDRPTLLSSPVRIWGEGGRPGGRGGSQRSLSSGRFPHLQTRKNTEMPTDGEGSRGGA